MEQDHNDSSLQEFRNGSRFWNRKGFY